MAEFRRFYNYGLEHTIHLEDLERSVLRHKNFSAGSEQRIGVVRRWLARTLMKLAQRIDPADTPHDTKPIHAV